MPLGSGKAITVQAATKEIKIVRANAEMAATLTQLALASKRHWGYPEPWMAAWEETLRITPELIGRHRVFVARSEGDPVGFYLLDCERIPAWLEHLWIVPGCIAQGIGRKLFAHAMAEANACYCASVLIESDPHAEGFYLAMGAKKIGRTSGETLGGKRELPLLQYCLTKVRSGST
ncbi:MAG TPA: GNAT family N-acetyltransferase [Verrucomicrobiae bacterium]|nr:GNAT family N-acetyltransferase [Verrucomicrobiae bacterium]